MIENNRKILLEKSLKFAVVLDNITIFAANCQH